MGRAPSLCIRAVDHCCSDGPRRLRNSGGATSGTHNGPIQMNRCFALLLVPMLLACVDDTRETGTPAAAPPAETAPANVPPNAPRVEILEPANGAEVAGT